MYDNFAPLKTREESCFVMIAKVETFHVNFSKRCLEYYSLLPCQLSAYLKKNSGHPNARYYKTKVESFIPPSSGTLPLFGPFGKISLKMGQLIAKVH